MQGYDIMEEMYNSKTAAMNLVHELCKLRPRGNLDTFMELCIGVMNEFQARSPGSPVPLAFICVWWRLAAGTLLDRVRTRCSVVPERSNEKQQWQSGQ